MNNEHDLEEDMLEILDEGSIHATADEARRIIRQDAEAFINDNSVSIRELMNKDEQYDTDRLKQEFVVRVMYSIVQALEAEGYELEGLI